MTSLRRRARSIEYCSNVMRSGRSSFSMIVTFGGKPPLSKPVRHLEQRQGMCRRPFAGQPALDLPPRHRTIARVKIRAARLDPLHHGPADLHGSLAKFPLDAVGSVMTRAAFDRLHGGSGHELQDVAGLQAE